MADPTNKKDVFELGSLDSKLDKVEIAKTSDKSDIIKNLNKPSKLSKGPSKQTITSSDVSSDRITSDVRNEFQRNSLADSYDKFAAFDATRLKQIALHDITSSITQERTISRAWAPKLRSLLPTELYGKLGGLSDKLGRSSSTDKLIALLTQKNQLNIDQYIRDKSDELVRDRIQQVGHRENITVLSQIFSMTKRNNAFFSGTFRKYLMKSIELKYKHIFVSKDILAHTKMLLDVTTSKLNAIKHNTSLPEAALESSFGAITSKLMNDATGIISNALFSRIRKPINDFISEAVASVGDKLSKYAKESVNYVAGNVPVEFDAENNTPRTSSNKFTHRAINRLRKTIHGVKEKAGYLGRSYGRADGTRSGAELDAGHIKGATGELVNHILSQKSSKNPLDHALNEYSRDKNNASGFSKTPNSFNAIPFDVMTRRSIVDVIPAFLSKIHRQSTIIAKMIDFSIKKRLSKDHHGAFDKVKATDELVFDRDTETFAASGDFNKRTSASLFGTKEDHTKLIQPIIKKMHTGFTAHGGDDKAFKTALPHIIRFVTNITTHAGVIKLSHIKKYLNGGSLSEFEQGYLDAILADIPKRLHKKILKIVGTTFFKDSDLKEVDLKHSDDITKSLHHLIEAKEKEITKVKHAKEHGDTRHLTGLFDKTTGKLDHKALRDLQSNVDHKAIQASLDVAAPHVEVKPTLSAKLKSHINKDTIHAKVGALHERVSNLVDPKTKRNLKARVLKTKRLIKHAPITKSILSNIGKLHHPVTTGNIVGDNEHVQATDVINKVAKPHSVLRHLKAKYLVSKRALRHKSVGEVAKSMYDSIAATAHTNIDKAIGQIHDPKTKRKLKARLLLLKRSIHQYETPEALTKAYDAIHDEAVRHISNVDPEHPILRHIKTGYQLARRKVSEAHVPEKVSTLANKVHKQVSEAIHSTHGKTTEHPVRVKAVKPKEHVNSLTEAIGEIRTSLHDHFGRAKAADNTKIRLLSKILKQLSIHGKVDGSHPADAEHAAKRPLWKRVIESPLDHLKTGIGKAGSFYKNLYGGLFGIAGKTIKKVLPSAEHLKTGLGAAGKLGSLGLQGVGKILGVRATTVKHLSNIVKSHLITKERFVDVYRKDNVVIGSPLLKGLDIKAGKYVYANGGVVRDSYSIKEPVLNAETQQTVVTAEDIKHGLVDYKNNKLSDQSILGIGGSIAHKLIRTTHTLTKASLRVSGKMIGAGADALTSLISRIPGLGGIKGALGKRGTGKSGETIDSKILGNMVTKHLVAITEMLKPIAEKHGYESKNSLVSKGLNRVKKGIKSKLTGMLGGAAAAKAGTDSDGSSGVGTAVTQGLVTLLISKPQILGGLAYALVTAAGMIAVKSLGNMASDKILDTLGIKKRDIPKEKELPSWKELYDSSKADISKNFNAAKDAITDKFKSSKEGEATGVSLAASHKSMSNIPTSGSGLTSAGSATSNAITTAPSHTPTGGDALNKSTPGLPDSSYKVPEKQGGGKKGENWKNIEGPIMKQLMGYGWSHAQAAGITANIYRESKGNPSSPGDSGKAYGIAQWHDDPPGKGRQSDFAKKYGKPIQGSSLSEQVDFINHELTKGTEKKAGNELKKATDAGSAGAIISKLYERPRDVKGEMNERSGFAQAVAKRNSPESLSGIGKDKDGASSEAVASTTPASDGKTDTASSGAAGAASSDAAASSTPTAGAATPDATTASATPPVSDGNLTPKTTNAEDIIKSFGNKSNVQGGYVAQATPAVSNVNRNAERTSAVPPALAAAAPVDPNSEKQTTLLTEQNAILSKIASILSSSDKEKEGDKSDDKSNPMLSKLDGILASIQGTNNILATNAQNPNGGSSSDQGTTNSPRYIDANPNGIGIDVGRIHS